MYLHRFRWQHHTSPPVYRARHSVPSLFSCLFGSNCGAGVYRHDISCNPGFPTDDRKDHSSFSIFAAAPPLGSVFAGPFPLSNSKCNLKEGVSFSLWSLSPSYIE
ncbi:hypothetical protein L208DRAFT_607530 [Tricholoma matsutake]|nr:hypothetical protein L208DRAFT_607530 [Tricholoma matsutake 945]